MSVQITSNMASNIAETPDLEPHVPKIIITEPSPMIRSSSMVVLADPQPDTRIVNIDEMAAEAISQGASPMTADELAEHLANDSYDEYSPAPPCGGAATVQGGGAATDQGSREASVCGGATAGVDQESRTSEREDAELGDLRRAPCCCPRFGGFKGFYYALSRATDGKYGIPLWILLMCMPIASGFMGARYLNECPYSPVTPALMLMIGIMGIIMTSVRILIVIHRLTCENQFLGPAFRSIINMSYILMVLLFTTEFMTFFSPSTSDSKYCHPTFYEFTFWINYVGIAVMVVMFVVRLPLCMLQVDTGARR